MIKYTWEVYYHAGFGGHVHGVITSDELFDTMDSCDFDMDYNISCMGLRNVVDREYIKVVLVP